MLRGAKYSNFPGGKPRKMQIKHLNCQSKLTLQLRDSFCESNLKQKNYLKIIWHYEYQLHTNNMIY